MEKTMIVKWKIKESETIPFFALSLRELTPAMGMKLC